MGPRSRELLSRLTRADLGAEAFPFGSSREITLGYSTVRATRITYVGELGWELYVPVEFAVGVYEDLMSAGDDLGVRNGGYYTIDQMRLEKGYRAFGRELTPDYGPIEAGLMFTCKLKTEIPFLGREAVERARSGGRPAPARLLRGRERRADALGRRAGAPRRGRVGPGDVGGVGRDARRVRRARLRLGSGGRRRRPGLGDQQRVRGGR